MRIMNKADSISTSMFFKTAERYFVMAVQLIVQIVVARLLQPSDYGIIAMMAVFINIANIFINNGFNMALVQKKDANEIDYATALSLNLIIGIFLYVVLFVSSPYIAAFYKQPLITKYLPFVGLVLIIGSVNSIQMAIANRQMHFKSLFYCNAFSCFISGICGIVSALCNMGAWALIIQQLSFSLSFSFIIAFQQHWVPKLQIDVRRAHDLFSFGWKMLVAGMINQIYTELNSLVIGKKYQSTDLAFYTKGSQFPKYVTMGVDASISTVMFSALSKRQDSKDELHNLMKKTIRVNNYIVFLCLGILGMIAHPLITLLLTDKWLGVVPFLQICCFSFALHPLSSTQVQAIAAVGRSDVRLMIEFPKKAIGIALLFFAMNYGPIGIALSAAVTGVISMIIGAVACKMIVGYSYRNSINDVLPTLLVVSLSCVSMYFASFVELNSLLSIIVISLVGLLTYLLASIVIRPYGFVYLIGFVKNRVQCKKK